MDETCNMHGRNEEFILVSIRKLKGKYPWESLPKME
jgi:hypothetical protein